MSYLKKYLGNIGMCSLSKTKKFMMNCHMSSLS